MKIIVTTTGCVDYEKKLYFKGDEIDLPDKTAKHLLDKGVCETLSHSPLEGNTPLSPPSHAAQAPALREGEFKKDVGQDVGQALPAPAERGAGGEEGETPPSFPPQGGINGDVNQVRPLRLSPAERDDGGQDGTIARTPALKQMTVAKLKKLLDKLEVSYKARTKKADLIALVEANTSD